MHWTFYIITKKNNHPIHKSRTIYKDVKNKFGCNLKQNLKELDTTLNNFKHFKRTTIILVPITRHIKKRCFKNIVSTVLKKYLH